MRLAALRACFGVIVRRRRPVWSCVLMTSPRYRDRVRSPRAQLAHAASTLAGVADHLLWGQRVKVPLSVLDHLDRAEFVYGDRVGVVDEPDQPAAAWGDVT